MMSQQCPSCQKALNLSSVQKDKIAKALANLNAGGSLKLNCPHCRDVIEISANGTFLKKGEKASPVAMKRPIAKGSSITPPGPPDVSWLADGSITEQDEIKDIPTALILLPEGDLKDDVTAAFIELFYQPVYAETVDEALDKMRFVNFSAVIFHPDFDSGKLEDSSFHKYMAAMNMSKRRNIYYVLIGPHFNTMYALQALAYSANLVVNEKEAGYLKIIVKKSQIANDNLFNPWINALKGYGNK